MSPRVAMALLALTSSCEWACQPSPLTPADTAILGAETDEQTHCIAENRGDGGAIDACRAKVRKSYDTLWAAKFADGGIGR